MLIFVTILLSVSVISVQQTFAHGQSPGICPNRYDGPITHAEIVAEGVSYDPIENPGVTFELPNDRSYILTFTIHTPTQSSQGNSDRGTTWFNTNINAGFYSGACVGNAESDSDVTITLVIENPSMIPEGTQRVEFSTLVSAGFYYYVTWVAPSDNDATVPFPPTNLSANALSSSQIDLSWEVPTDDGGSPITEYLVFRYNNCDSITFCAHTTRTGSTATTYSDFGLDPNTTYHYRVYAVNEAGISSPSNAFSATTLATLSLTVNTIDKLGNPLEGIWMQLESADGNIIAEGFTPITFDVNQGEPYTILANNYNQHIFLHWEDGSIDSSRDVTPTEDISMTATYTITTVDQLLP